MSSESRDFRLWWQLFCRRRYYIIISVVFALLAGFYLAMTTPPEFQAAATLMIVDTDLLSGSQLRFVPGSPQHNEVEYFRRRISSEGFLLQLLDSLDLHRNAKLNARIAQVAAENPHIDRAQIAAQLHSEYLLNRISTRMRSYNIIEISAREATSAGAFRLASLVTNLAILESQKSRIETVAEASDFTLQQLEIYRKRLEVSEARLAAFNQGVTERGISSGQLSAEKLTELQSIKLSTAIDLESRRTQMEQLRDTALSGLSLDYEAELDRELAAMTERMAQRTDDVCELVKRFRWEDVDVILLNEEIGQLKRDIFERIRQLLAGWWDGRSSEVVAAAVSYEQLRLEIRMLQRTSERMDASIEGHYALVRSRPSQDGYKVKLERDVVVNREVYEMLLQSSRGTQIRESAETKGAKMKFKLITAPQRPLERIKPQRAKIMVIALLAGLGLALAMVMVREAVDITLRSIEDVSRHLDVPVLAAIPRIETRKEQARRQRLRRLAVLAVPFLALVSLIWVVGRFIH